jgi:hypothetical protein
VACLEAVVASGASLSPVAMHNPRHGGHWTPHESGHGAAVYVVFNQLSLSIVMFLKEEFRVDRNQEITLEDVMKSYNLEILLLLLLLLCFN